MASHVHSTFAALLIVAAAAGGTLACKGSASSGGDEKKTDNAGEKAKEEKSAPTCAATYKALDDDAKKGEYTCKCKKGKADGAVWGVGIYTTDSSICAAAVHAGAIEDAGEVTLKPAKGCAAYDGKEKHGVTSKSWGSFDGSFYFVGKGSAKCFEPPPSAKCPATFKDVPDFAKTDTSVTCACDSTNESGSVWGVGLYTTDSSICAAAVHAGAIKKGDAGTVTAKRAPGCPKYNGSDKNGVKTASWGKFDSSFYFDGKGSGTCAAEDDK